MSLPPYLRTEMHQHQHQHTHLHQHSHLMPPPPLGSALVPSSSSHLFDKIPKLDTPYFRQTMGLPAYSGLSSLINPPSAGPSSTPFNPPNPVAAFQPKMSQLEKNKNMKSGRWCAMHVRIAWEIYNHQQKQQAEAHKVSAGAVAAVAAAAKAADLIRQPSHIFPTLHRPHGHEIPLTSSSASSLIGPGGPYKRSGHPRAPFEAALHHNSFLGPNAAHLPPGVSPFARPAYPPGFGGAVNSFGGLGSLGGFLSRPDAAEVAKYEPMLKRDLISGGTRELASLANLQFSPMQEQWNQIRRAAAASFPSGISPSWVTKADVDRERHQREEHEREHREHRERERERERKAAAELEKNREMEREREREKEREREREVERQQQKERDRETRALHRATPSFDSRNGDDGGGTVRSRERPKDRRDGSRSPVRAHNSSTDSRARDRDFPKSDSSAFDNILNTSAPKVPAQAVGVGADVRIKEEPKKDEDVVVIPSGPSVRDREREREREREKEREREHRDREREIQRDRMNDAALANNYLARTLPLPHGMLDRNRVPPGGPPPPSFGIPPPPPHQHPPHPQGHAGSAGSALERAHHLAVWPSAVVGPLRDYRSLDFHTHHPPHHLDMRDMERERDHMMPRFNPMAPMMFRERNDVVPQGHPQDYARHHLDAERFQLERDRTHANAVAAAAAAAYDRANKSGGIRPGAVDTSSFLNAAGLFPLVAGLTGAPGRSSKNGSPLNSVVGVPPPPLIPSSPSSGVVPNHAVTGLGSASQLRSHSASPAVHSHSKLNAPSPAENSLMEPHQVQGRGEGHHSAKTPKKETQGASAAVANPTDLDLHSHSQSR